MSDMPTVGPLVVGIVVTFNPDATRLRSSVAALMPQVDRLIVVDNGSANAASIGTCLPPGAELIALERNLGIAAAQNAGIRLAQAAGARHALLLDQDSVPATGMVDALCRAVAALKATGRRVAAVGPTLQGSGVATAFVRFGWFRYRQCAPGPAEPWVLCDLLIASGCLLSLEALPVIGPMDEGLFIDKVDTEWCLRATSFGYVLAGVPAAVLHHRLGERTLRVWWGRWRQLPAHHPFRYYYIVRNSLLLWRRPYATWRWRTADFKQCLQIAVFFGVLSSARRGNLPMLAKGLADGLRGRTGPAAPEQPPHEPS